MINGIISGIQNLFNLFSFLIILRIFLSWIPNINWYNQPWKTINDVVEPYLGLFRRIIPPFGGLDFSPIIALLVLQFIVNILIYIVLTFR